MCICEIERKENNLDFESRGRVNSIKLKICILILYYYLGFHTAFLLVRHFTYGQLTRCIMYIMLGATTPLSGFGSMSLPGADGKRTATAEMTISVSGRV